MRGQIIRVFQSAMRKSSGRSWVFCQRIQGNNRCLNVIFYCDDEKLVDCTLQSPGQVLVGHCLRLVNDMERSLLNNLSPRTNNDYLALRLVLQDKAYQVTRTI